MALLPRLVECEVLALLRRTAHSRESSQWACPQPDAIAGGERLPAVASGAGGAGRRWRNKGEEALWMDRSPQGRQGGSTRWWRAAAHRALVLVQRGRVQHSPSPALMPLPPSLGEDVQRLRRGARVLEPAHTEPTSARGGARRRSSDPSTSTSTSASTSSSTWGTSASTDSDAGAGAGRGKRAPATRVAVQLHLNGIQRPAAARRHKARC